MIKSYNELVEEDKSNILKCFKDGEMVKNIPSILNVSERAVARVLKETGVNTKRRNRYSLNESYFDSIDTERQAYILGLLFADGFVGNIKYNNISLSLMDKDVYMLEEIKKEFEYTGNIRKSKRSGGYDTNNDIYVINFSSPKMANSLRMLGMNDTKSKRETFIPDIKPELLRHFIRGYFDGDGSVHTGYKSVTHRMSTGEMKEYRYFNCMFSIIIPKRCIQSFLDVIPVPLFARQSKSEGMVYMSNSSKKHNKTIYKYLYEDSTIFIKRKHDKFLEFIEHSLSN